MAQRIHSKRYPRIFTPHLSTLKTRPASDLRKLNRQLSIIRTEQAKLDQEMRLPGNEVVLDRSVLINTLIRRKAISWTKIFSDLATVMPPDVRVIAIRPQVNALDQLSLD